MEQNTTYSIKTGFGQMDFDRITAMLGNAFWSTGIKKPEVIKGAQNSALLVGVFNEENVQIAYSRVISDKTRFAYILDVYVDENYRKQGIGQAMVRHILSHPELKDIYQWALITKDAHGVYEKVGFYPLTKPNSWMQLRFDRPLR